MTAADLAAAIKKKQVSPVEVVDAVLARIEKTKRLNAYSWSTRTARETPRTPRSARS
jgi:Asp-tRNA(Asn)/Glu-tRNA(Gln) amidotransferase A subunit family amidase